MEETPSYNSSPAGLRTFITCKRVQAAKIARIEQGTEPPKDASYGGTWVLHFDGALLPIEVPHEWYVRRGAKPGGYFVLYPDGYTSWSPAEAFEESATPEEEWGLPVSQEPKYTVNLRGRLANRESGNPIPDDEPVMVLRGQDRVAFEAVLRYRDHAEDEEAAETILRGAFERMTAFANFALHNTFRMKDPT
jgi:hypothetical protein